MKFIKQTFDLSNRLQIVVILIFSNYYLTTLDMEGMKIQKNIKNWNSRMLLI